ncbi:MAG: sugar nucleotide-binding protein [Nitrososphaeria archaeon]
MSNCNKDAYEFLTRIFFIKNDVIMHTAALTDVDKREVDRDLAMKVNFEGTANVSKVVRKKNSFFIYVSTDYYSIVIKVSIVRMMILIL